jgi:hypothetical protein
MKTEFMEFTYVTTYNFAYHVFTSVFWFSYLHLLDKYSSHPAWPDAMTFIYKVSFNLSCALYTLVFCSVLRHRSSVLVHIYIKFLTVVVAAGMRMKQASVSYARIRNTTNVKLLCFYIWMRTSWELNYVTYPATLRYLKIEAVDFQLCIHSSTMFQCAFCL